MPVDGSMFDRLTQRLATGSSRRQALVALAAIGLGGALAADPQLTEAKKNKKNKKLGESCNKAKECQSGLHCNKLFNNKVCNTQGTRCCAKNGTKCPHGDCDCCKGFHCRFDSDSSKQKCVSD
jgi:hypothetical protein